MKNLIEIKNKNWIYFNTKIGEWSILQSQLFKNITFNIEKMRTGENGVFIFTSGKWKQLNEDQFLKLLSNILKKRTFELTTEHIPIPHSLVRHLYLSILSVLSEFPSSGDIINSMSDGTYKVITKDFVYRITPKTCEVNKVENKGQFYNFACLDNFDIEEQSIFSPTLKKFFDNITQNDENYLSYLQEMIGSCLLNQTSPEPYIYILYGGGKNGKSAFNRMLSYVVFHQMASIEFSDINPQNLMLFESKYINCPSEISDKTFNSSIMKAITSGDPVGVNEKYKDPRKIIPIAKQIASCNKLPNLNDSSFGMWRRLQILPFDFKINSSNKIDENSLFKCFSDESKELRKWAFQGLLRFIKNDGEHTKVKKIIEATQSYKEDENNVHQFLKIFFQFIVENHSLIREKKYTHFNNQSVDPNIFKYEKGSVDDPKVVLSDLYPYYKNWAQNQGFKPLSVKSFRTKIKEEYIPEMDLNEYGPLVALQFLIYKYLPKKD